MRSVADKTKALVCSAEGMRSEGSLVLNKHFLHLTSDMDVAYT